VTYSVVQWATGAIGKTCLRGVLDRPELELVGLYVYGERKEGADAGTIARYPRRACGPPATSTRYSPSTRTWSSTPPASRFPTRRTTPTSSPCCAGQERDHHRGRPLPQAHGPSARHSSSRPARRWCHPLRRRHESGLLLERLVLGLTGVCVELESVDVEEMLDASTMPDPDFVFNVMGMGSDPATLDLSAGPLTVLFGKLYAEAIRFFGDRTGTTFERIQADHRVLPATRDLAVSAGVIPAGTVAATEWRWHGIADGSVRDAVGHLDDGPTMPEYEGRNHWTVHLEGKPVLDLTLDMADPTDSRSRRRLAIHHGRSGAQRHSDVVAAPPGISRPPSSPRSAARGHCLTAIEGRPPTPIFERCNSLSQAEQ